MFPQGVSLFAERAQQLYVGLDFGILRHTVGAKISQNGYCAPRGLPERATKAGFVPGRGSVFWLAEWDFATSFRLAAPAYRP